MNAKKFLPLIAALVMGLLAARIALHAIGNKSAPQDVAKGPTAKMVVAARDLAAGQEISDSDVTDSPLSGSQPLQDSFSDSSMVVGRVVAIPMLAGQAVLENSLAPRGSGSGLQAVIPAGMRALTIDVNEVSGVAGYVMPGSRVDIVQTLHDDATNQPVARCIAEDLQVTAVGTRDASWGEKASCVTLLVTPRQAETIELASTNGRPRLVLRGWRDSTKADPGVIGMSELTGGWAKPIEPADRKIDPFSTSLPSTQPAPADNPTDAFDRNQWPVRVITAGEESVVHVQQPASAAGSMVGNTPEQTRQATVP